MRDNEMKAMNRVQRNAVARNREKGCPGFTLIELLASITILMLIVSVMGMIFAESDRAWNLGTGRVESNTEARAALDLIAQDMQYAIADEVLTFVMRPDIVRSRPGGVPADRWPVLSYGVTNSEACFISLQGEADPRASEKIYYWVREVTSDDTFAGTPLGRYQLMRTRMSTETGQYDPYHAADWFESLSDRHNPFPSGVIADNIAAFALFGPDEDGDTTREYYSDDNGNRLPEYVDVYIETLSERDAARIEDMGADPDDPVIREFVEKNVRRYTTRVYFHNRSGYLSRFD